MQIETVTSGHDILMKEASGDIHEYPLDIGLNPVQKSQVQEMINARIASQPVPPTGVSQAEVEQIFERLMAVRESPENVVSTVKNLNKNIGLLGKQLMEWINKIRRWFGGG